MRWERESGCEWGESRERERGVWERRSGCERGGREWDVRGEGESEVGFERGKERVGCVRVERVG